MRKDRSLSVVLPVYNEVETIEQIIMAYYNEIVAKHPNSELIIAEDGSTDGTKKVLAKLEKKIDVRLAMGEERKGYLRGVSDALLLAKNDLVFFSDSDGQHDPKDFWKLLAHSDKFDIVCGIRSHRDDSLPRKLYSKAYNSIVSRRFGLYLSDMNAGFKLMGKDVVDAVVGDVKHLTYGFSTELLIRSHGLGFKIAGVPIGHAKRVAGISDQFTIGNMLHVTGVQMSGMKRLKRELVSKGQYPKPSQKVPVISA